MPNYNKFPTLIPSEVPEIMIAIKQGRKRKDGTIQLTGWVMDRETNMKIPEIPERIKRASSESMISTVRKRICYELTEAFLTIRKEQNAHEDVDVLEGIKHALQELSTAALAGRVRLSPRWKSPATNIAAIRYFSLHFLNILAPYISGERIFLPADAVEIKETIYSSVKENKRSLDDATAENTAIRHLTDANIIYSYLCDLIPTLPVFSITDGLDLKRKPVTECIKSLPHSIFRNFCSSLEGEVEAHPELVFAAVHLIYGCRAGEACGRRPVDIKIYDSYATSAVVSQADASGKLKSDLKNDQSRRCIPISYWGRCVLAKAMCRITASNLNSDVAPVKKAELASFVRNLLYEAGLDEESFGALASINGFDRTPSEDVSRILRRHFASIMRNTMGQTFEAVDDCMGHSDRFTKNLINPNNTDDQQKIAANMERYVFSESLSLNPAVHPYEIGVSTPSFDLIPFSVYRFVNAGNQPVMINLCVRSAEAGEKIVLDTPADTHVNSSSIPIRFDYSNTDRCVIGKTTLD